MAVRISATNEPIIPADSEARALHDAACSLAAVEDNALQLVLADGTTIQVPASVITVVRQAIEVMSENLAVTITPVDKRLTPRQAARMLNVGDDYFETLLQTGDIQFTNTGVLRFIALEELLAYKRQRDATRRDALKELTRLSQEMGLYDIEP